VLNTHSTFVHRITQLPADLFVDGFTFSYAPTTLNNPKLVCHFADLQVPCETFSNGVTTCKNTDMLFSNYAHHTLTCVFSCVPTSSSSATELTYTLPNGNKSSYIYGLPLPSPSTWPQMLIDEGSLYSRLGDVAPFAFYYLFDILAPGDTVELSAAGTEGPFFQDDLALASADPSYTIEAVDNKLILTGVTGAVPADGFYRVATSIPLTYTGAKKPSMRVVITRANGDQRSASVPLGFNYYLPPTHELVAQDSLDSPQAAVTFNSNYQQDVEVVITKGMLNGNPVVTGFSCDLPTTNLVEDAESFRFTMSYSFFTYTTYFPRSNIETAEFTLSYAENYKCAGLCPDAPTISVYGAATPAIAKQLVNLAYFSPTMAYSETSGDFNAADVGFALTISRAATTELPTLANNFGLVAGQAVPVYAIVDEEVSTDAIGSFAPKAGDDTVLEFTIATGLDETDIFEAKGPTFAAKTWAVPVFNAGHLLPTLTAAPVVVKLFDVVLDSLTIGNGLPTFTSEYSAPAEILSSTDFDFAVNFTSTHLDDLEIAIATADTAVADIVACYDTHDAELTLVGSGNKVTFTAAHADTEAVPGNAFYEVKCTVTAVAYDAAAATAPSTVSVSVTRGSTTEQQIDVALPAVTRAPTATTKVTVDIDHDALLSAKILALALEKAARVLTAVSSAFTFEQFYVIEQELVTSPAPVALAADSTTSVVLSAHVVGISVADVDSLAASIGPELTNLGLTATVRPAEASTMAYQCETECGPADCGQCLDGRACDAVEDCFSTCEAGVCKSPNSAASISVYVVAAIAALAAAVLV
jgi:hypothetical protein